MARPLFPGPGLGGWNCRHSFFPYFEGSPRTYSPETLAELEQKKYTYNGCAMTEYEATQQQRYIERQIRRWKRENAAMNAAGQDMDESAAKTAHWQRVQADFLGQTGLKRQTDREQIWRAPRGAAADAMRNTGKRVVFSENASYKVDISRYSAEVNAALSDACKRVARAGSKDRLEHLFLVDIEKGKTVYREIGEENEVGYEGFWQYLREHEAGSFAFVHNHNTDGWLSEQDIQTLLTNPVIDAMIAVRADGVIYAAPKDRGAELNTFLDMRYADDIRELRRKAKADEHMMFSTAREEMLVGNALRDFVKEYAEYDTRK